MDHVAVDLGARQSHVCVRDATGVIVQDVRVKSASLREYFAQRSPSRVVLEACSEAFAVAQWAREFGHQVTVVPSTLAPALGVGARGVKTDKRDAANLSLASCRMTELPSVHVPSAKAKELRQLLASRAALVRMRTIASNHIRGYLRQRVVTLAKGSVATLTKRVRAELLAREEGIPRHLELLLATVDSLSQQLRAADDELRALTEEDSICQRLMTVPGIGPVTAGSYRAAVDDAQRFPNAHAVQAYLGLTPGEDSSGDRKLRLHISKAGPPLARAALVQAAWVTWRTAQSEPMVIWAKKVAERRGNKVAIVALARKLAGILFALWRDSSEYSSQYS